MGKADRWCTSCGKCHKGKELGERVASWGSSSGLVAQSCLILCNPTDCSPPGSSVHWILQARILEWVAISFSRGSSWPRDWAQVSCTAGRFLGVIFSKGKGDWIWGCLVVLASGTSRKLTSPHLAVFCIPVSWSFFVWGGGKDGCSWSWTSQNSYPWVPTPLLASSLLLLVQLASCTSLASSICLQSLVSVLSTLLCSHLHSTSLCHHETSQKFCPSVWWLVSHPLLSPSSLEVWLLLSFCTQQNWSLFVRRSIFSRSLQLAWLGASGSESPRRLLSRYQLGPPTPEGFAATRGSAPKVAYSHGQQAGAGCSLGILLLLHVGPSTGLLKSPRYMAARFPSEGFHTKHFTHNLV